MPTSAVRDTGVPARSPVAETAGSAAWSHGHLKWVFAGVIAWSFAAGALVVVFAGTAALLGGVAGPALAPALAAALCAAVAEPLVRAGRRIASGGGASEESTALRQLAVVTSSADSPAAIAEAFCGVARDALGLPAVAVYLRQGERLVPVAGDVPAALQQGVPVQDVRPLARSLDGRPVRAGAGRQDGTRLLSAAEMPRLAGAGPQGWIVLESDTDMLAAVSIASPPRAWGAGARDHRLLLSLCRDLAQSLRSVEIFAEFAAIETLARDLEIGREVQAGFLSRPVPVQRGIQIAARCRAAREVGGDFFDVLAVEGGRWGLLIGDATGRGVAAALHMAMTLSFFRSLVPGASSPRQVLETINGLICRYRASPKTFVSACYGIYDCRDKTLTLANAGMPPPVLNGRPLDLKGLPLGARARAAFREEKIPLTSGDVLVLMSDGINAARPGGQKLGWERVFRLVADHCALSADGMLEQMLRLTGEWAGGTPGDDATLICLKIGEGGTRQVRGPTARHTRKLGGVSHIFPQSSRA